MIRRWSLKSYLKMNENEIVPTQFGSDGMIRISSILLYKIQKYECKKPTFTRKKKTFSIPVNFSSEYSPILYTNIQLYEEHLTFNENNNKK